LSDVELFGQGLIEVEVGAGVTLGATGVLRLDGRLSGKTLRASCMVIVLAPSLTASSLTFFHPAPNTRSQSTP
jgi:hypothetical protein